MRNFCAGRSALAALALVLVGTYGARGSEKYYPKDTEVLVALNIRQMLGSELAKNNKASMDKAKAAVQQSIEGDAEAQRYMKLLGFDLFRDLDNVTMLLPGSADYEKSLVIGQGKFDSQKFSAAAADAAQKHGDVIKVTKAGNAEVVEISSPNDGKMYYLCVADGSTLLIAFDRTTLTAALDRQKNAGADLSKNVQELVSKRDAKQSLTFLATSGAIVKLSKELAKLKQEFALVGPIVQQYDAFTGFVDVRNAVQFQLSIVTKDANGAKKLARELGELIPLGAITIATQAQNDPKLAPLVDAIRAIRPYSDGNTVVIRGELPATVIEQFLKK